MYVEFHVGRPILRDDIIIYDRRYGADLLEFTVMTKKEIFGTRGKKIGYRVILFKSPKKDSIPEVEFRSS